MRGARWTLLWLVAAGLGMFASPARADGVLDRLERAQRERDDDALQAVLSAVRAEDASTDRAEALATRIANLLREGRRAAHRVEAAGALRRLGLASGYRAAAAAAAVDPDPEVAEAAARTAGALADAERVAVLMQSVTVPSIRSRILGALALGATTDPRARPLLRRLLIEDPAEGPRAAAALALQAGADTDTIALLVERLAREVAPQVQAACAEALEAITGEKFGLNAGAWRDAQAAGRLRPGTAAPATPPTPGHSVAADTLTRWTVTYWGIPVTDDGLVFCVDVSGSMNFYDRWTDSTRELRATIARLPSHVRFGVCFFNDRVGWWLPRLAPAGPLAKHLLLQRLEACDPKRTTDIFGLLERVFGLVGSGRYPVQPPEQLRAVFLLTDGLPSNDYIQDTAYIRRVVRQWNVGGRVRVHCIALAMAADDFLRGLAEDNRGQFVAKGKRE